MPLIHFCREYEPVSGNSSMTGAFHNIAQFEDGATIAAVLQVAGKENVPPGVRTWEQIR
jgi:hypothetical protein